MIVGFYAPEGGNTPRSPTHVISEETMAPICGTPTDGEPNQVSRGIFYSSVECPHCKKLIAEWWPSITAKDADPFWPVVQMKCIISAILDNEVDEVVIMTAKRLVTANWIQALANGNPSMLQALNEEVKAMMLEGANEYFRPD